MEGVITNPNTSNPPSRTTSILVHGPIRQTLFMLAWPVLGEQLLNTFVGLFDTYLAGRISASATSAVGLAAYVSWLASMLLMLVGTGTTALVSRYRGSFQFEEARAYANQSLTLAGGLGLGLCLLIYSLAPAFARYSNMVGETYAIAIEYLHYAAFAHLFLSVTLVGCAALRGAGDTRTPLVIFAVINSTNIAAAYGLVYGMGPLPRMGVTGIVCGTVIAQVVGAALTISILVAGRAGLQIRSSELFISRSRASRILHIGIPAAADGAVMWIGHFLFLAIISRLATPPLSEAIFAAHVIAVRVESFTYLPAVAWGAAVATMIGQNLGAGKPQRAKRIGHEGVLQCGLLAIGIGSFFFFSADWIFAQMSKDPLVQSAGVTPFRILALLQPCMAVSIVYIGGLRGAGDTRFPLLVSTIGTVLIRVPLGYYFGIVCNGGLIGAWSGMFGDMIWRAIAGATRFLSGRWINTRI